MTETFHKPIQFHFRCERLPDVCPPGTVCLDIGTADNTMFCVDVQGLACADVADCVSDDGETLFCGQNKTCQTPTVITHSECVLTTDCRKSSCSELFGM